MNHGDRVRYKHTERQDITGYFVDRSLMGVPVGQYTREKMASIVVHWDKIRPEYKFAIIVDPEKWLTGWREKDRSLYFSTFPILTQRWEVIEEAVPYKPDYILLNNKSEEDKALQFLEGRGYLWLSGRTPTACKGIITKSCEGYLLEINHEKKRIGWLGKTARRTPVYFVLDFIAKYTKKEQENFSITEEKKEKEMTTKNQTLNDLMSCAKDGMKSAGSLEAAELLLKTVKKSLDKNYPLTFLAKVPMLAKLEPLVVTVAVKLAVPHLGLEASQAAKITDLCNSATTGAFHEFFRPLLTKLTPALKEMASSLKSE